MFFSVETIPFYASISCFRECEPSEHRRHTGTEPLFGETYPKEQWYSENFGNSFLNAAAKEHGPRGLPQLDWFFGPMAFRAR